MACKVDKIKLTREQDRRAKFSDEQVNKMRELYLQGYTQKAIAEMFNARRNTVCYIVSETAHKHLAEYRKTNPPKRRTTEEAREYQRNLRRYKMKINHIFPKKETKKKEINKEADCTKCIYAHKKEEHIYECSAENYDIETLSCYMPRTPKERGGEK